MGVSRIRRWHRRGRHAIFEQTECTSRATRQRRVPNLRLKPTNGDAGSHGDEVLACAYAPDGRLALSGGWDGHLRLWDAATGAFQKDVAVSKKPVSAAAVTPDGTQLVSGTLDGMLTHWNAVSLQQLSTFLAHSRPISSILF